MNKLIKISGVALLAMVLQQNYAAAQPGTENCANDPITTLNSIQNHMQNVIAAIPVPYESYAGVDQESTANPKQLYSVYQAFYNKVMGGFPENAATATAGFYGLLNTIGNAYGTPAIEQIPATGFLLDTATLIDDNTKNSTGIPDPALTGFDQVGADDVWVNPTQSGYYKIVSAGNVFLNNISGSNCGVIDPAAPTIKNTTVYTMIDTSSTYAVVWINKGTPGYYYTTGDTPGELHQGTPTTIVPDTDVWNGSTADGHTPCYEYGIPADIEGGQILTKAEFMNSVLAQIDIELPGDEPAFVAQVDGNCAPTHETIEALSYAISCGFRTSHRLIDHLNTSDLCTEYLTAHVIDGYFNHRNSGYNAYAEEIGGAFDTFRTATWDTMYDDLVASYKSQVMAWDAAYNQVGSMAYNLIALGETMSIATERKRATLGLIAIAAEAINALFTVETLQGTIRPLFGKDISTDEVLINANEEHNKATIKIEANKALENLTQGNGTTTARYKIGSSIQ